MIVNAPGGSFLATFGSFLIFVGCIWWYSAAGSTFGGGFESGIMLIGPSSLLLVGVYLAIARISVFVIDKREGVFRIKTMTWLCFPTECDVPIAEIGFFQAPMMSRRKSGAPMHSMCLEKHNGERVQLETGRSTVGIAAKQKCCREMNAFLGLSSAEGNTGVVMMATMAMQQKMQQTTMQQPIVAQVVQCPLTPQLLPVFGGSDGGGSVAQRLQQLADLKAAGALTEAEFQAAKQAELRSVLSTPPA